MDIYNQLDKLPKSVVNEILIECLLDLEYNNAKLLLEYGADINYELLGCPLIHQFFEKNGYRDEFMKILEEYNYDLDIRNKQGKTILGSQIDRYIRDRYTNETIINKLLSFGYDIAFEDLNNVTGVEYGGDNHYWRRQRINWLIKKGINYCLNKCIYKKHPKCTDCRLLRNTRLGYYLLHRKLISDIQMV